MNDDAALLRRYAEEGSEAAFTELVQRHVDLVYGAAMRRTNGDTHAAADVAQQVFTMLARNAGKLSRHTVLAAWLHTATRNAALNLMISEQRRKTRETEALALEAVTGAADTGVHDAMPDWDELRPMLDAAIDELPETDRAAVVLRCLERRPFAEIGAVLKLSTDAARMRTDRALEKLRAALARRGVTSTAAALGVLVSGQPIVAAPAGLAATLALESIAAGGAGFFATLMTTKIITTLVLSALVAFGAGTYVGLTHEKETATVATATDDIRQARLIASLRKDNQQLSADMAALQTETATAKEAVQVAVAMQTAAAAAGRKSPNIGGQRYELQQAVMNNLRQIDAARKQYQLEKGHPAASIEDLVGVKKYIKTVRTVGGEDYWDLPMAEGQPLSVTTPDGVNITFDPAGTTTTKIEIPPAVQRMQELGAKVQPTLMKAVDAYRRAHNGANPPNEEAILAHFATPQEGADYVEFMEARKAANGQ